jgi:hypothetical protein
MRLSEAGRTTAGEPATGASTLSTPPAGVWTWLCSTILDDAEAAARAGKWLTWAIAYADSIDPLSSSVPRLPDPADLDPADLKPGGSTLRGTRPAAPRSVCGRDQETEM